MLEGRGVGRPLSGGGEPKTRYMVQLALGERLWNDDFLVFTSWEGAFAQAEPQFEWRVDPGSIGVVKEGPVQSGRRSTVSAEIKQDLARLVPHELGRALAETRSVALEAATPAKPPTSYTPRL